MLFVLILSTAIGAAPDLTGAWQLEFIPDFSGHPSTHDCTFTQEGQRLTIGCDGQKMTGEVKGRNVTFQHKAGKQDELNAVYRGTVDEKGTTIKGVWQLTPGNQEGRFEARRQQQK
jgi:hypothetical protein